MKIIFLLICFSSIVFTSTAQIAKPNIDYALNDTLKLQDSVTKYMNIVKQNFNNLHATKLQTSLAAQKYTEAIEYNMKIKEYYRTKLEDLLEMTKRKRHPK
jgi:cell shape-determining protein MreC